MFRLFKELAEELRVYEDLAKMIIIDLDDGV